MKLWIRSADREHFTEAHGIDYNMDCIVDSMTEEERYCHKIVDDRGKVLGIYETKERCLEIIDEIQELLKLGNPENAFMHLHNCNMDYYEIEELIKRVRETKTIITRDADFEIIMPSDVTYQMPEE